MTTTPLVVRFAGLAATAALVVGGVVAGSSGAEVAPAPEATTASAATPPRVITHHGVGALDLGDGPRKIRAAGGEVRGSYDHGTCRALVLPGREARPHRVDGYVAPGRGLTAIFARPGMRTSEGIHLGSTVAAVKDAYPRLSTKQLGYRDVVVGDGVRYLFGFEKGRVVELSLADDEQPCFD